jgi:hypothetical protein
MTGEIKQHHRSAAIRRTLPHSFALGAGMLYSPSMSSFFPLRPWLALLAALVAHVAYLQVTDAIGSLATWGWYTLILLGLSGFAWFCWEADFSHLVGGAKEVDAPVIRAMGLALILVGAGYSTNLEPSVLKLGGVLPLGWSCAVFILLLEQLRCLAKSMEPQVRPNPYWVLLLPLTLMQAAADQFEFTVKGNGLILKWTLTALLFQLAADWLHAWHRIRQSRQ